MPVSAKAMLEQAQRLAARKKLSSTPRGKTEAEPKVDQSPASGRELPPEETGPFHSSGGERRGELAQAKEKQAGGTAAAKKGEAGEATRSIAWEKEVRVDKQASNDAQQGTSRDAIGPEKGDGRSASTSDAEHAERMFSLAQEVDRLKALEDKYKHELACLRQEPDQSSIRLGDTQEETPNTSLRLASETSRPLDQAPRIKNCIMPLDAPGSPGAPSAAAGQLDQERGGGGALAPRFRLNLSAVTEERDRRFEAEKKDGLAPTGCKGDQEREAPSSKPLPSRAKGSEARGEGLQEEEKEEEEQQQQPGPARAHPPADVPSAACKDEEAKPESRPASARSRGKARIEKFLTKLQTPRGCRAARGQGDHDNDEIGSGKRGEKLLQMQAPETPPASSAGATSNGPRAAASTVAEGERGGARGGEVAPHAGAASLAQESPCAAAKRTSRWVSRIQRQHDMLRESAERARTPRSNAAADPFRAQSVPAAGPGELTSARARDAAHEGSAMAEWMQRAARKTLHQEWEVRPDLSDKARCFIDGGHTLHHLLALGWSWQARARERELAESPATAASGGLSSLHTSRASRWAQRAAAASAEAAEGASGGEEMGHGGWPLMSEYVCRYGAAVECSKVSLGCLRELQDKAGTTRVVGTFGSLPASVCGVLVWARPACAHVPLENAHLIRGNIAVIMRSSWLLFFVVRLAILRGVSVHIDHLCLLVAGFNPRNILCCLAPPSSLLPASPPPSPHPEAQGPEAAGQERVLVVEAVPRAAGWRARCHFRRARPRRRRACLHAPHRAGLAHGSPTGTPTSLGSAYDTGGRHRGGDGSARAAAVDAKACIADGSALHEGLGDAPGCSSSCACCHVAPHLAAAGCRV
jgi:hypothetical protein